MKDLLKPTIRTGLMLLPLIAGIWVYANGRQTKTIIESWLALDKHTINIPFSGSLPDYLWCLSFLIAVTFLWKGWNRIPHEWKLIIWVLVCCTELLQYLNLIPGTGDLMDLVFYQAAFATVILLHKTNSI